MQLTSQQQAIIASSGDIKINAVAGSGKTSTLIEYARARSSARRMLYIAFNRSVRLEAQRRFAESGAGNVDVQTAHSLAFRHIVPRHGYQVCSGYKAHDILRLLDLGASHSDPHRALLVASHIGKLTNLFCNQATPKVDQVDYSLTLGDDPGAQAFALKHYDEILLGARKLLGQMDRAQIPVTHEFYLKKFQLSAPELGYEYVLFDEGQDASPVMLDIFLRQRGVKVIVGDAHQQIYGWRYAVNALQGVSFTDIPLTTSFRFGPDIAELAMDVLSWKQVTGAWSPVEITGVGKAGKTKTRATLARTNLALLKAAIDASEGRHGLDRVYFEGNISSYTYAAEGANVYDILALHTGERERIRDPMVAAFEDFDLLKEYAEQAADPELKMLIDMVTQYGRRLPKLLKSLRDRHVSDENRAKAQMVFSTVHRCKGMEYDHVTLADDFMTRERLRSTIQREGREHVNTDRLNEEINLVYVALTRTRGGLSAPDAMFPGRTPEPSPKKSLQKKHARPDGLSRHSRTRATHAKAYQPWSESEENELRASFLKGSSPAQLCDRLGRNRGAIAARLQKLGLTD